MNLNLNNMAKKSKTEAPKKAKVAKKKTESSEDTVNELPITRVIKHGGGYIVHRGDGHAYSSSIVSENPLEDEE